MQNHWRSVDKRFKTVFEANPFGLCKRDVLDLKWTPIVTRATNIPLGGNIKCRRNQFPVVSASAITIHKSQGGTFDEVVFNYDKSQQIQLVYVALSRVTSIDGLYLTNDKDGFKFYHGRGSMAPTVKDIRDEYDRMVNHRLPTLSMQARPFCKRDVLAERNEDQGGYLHRRRQLILIVSAFNAQSLAAHAGDIESDNILMNSDYMVISETWMNCANTVRINGFELRASNNTALEHRTHCPSTSSELPVRVSAAGGSAIYRNLQSSKNCSEIIVNANKSCGNSVLRKHNVVDICLVDVKVEDLTLFILGAVYIHPKASAEAVKLCLYQSLLPYSANLTKLIPNSQPDLETPIVLCGDFNCDPQQNSYLVEFMRNKFGLNYERNPVIKKKPAIKEELIVKEVEMEVLSENNPVIKKMSCEIKKELIEEVENEVLSASSHLEIDRKVINQPTKRKLPRSLLGILENNLNYQDYVTPKRKTKVSQSLHVGVLWKLQENGVPVLVLSLSLDQSSKLGDLLLIAFLLL
ncbi:ATP-dependent DNA helicase [Trichonephila clavipes]|nr:ATP-dependent DNA helicase [Trichonephila clavipes]